MNELIDGFLDDRLSEDERRELARLIESDEAARRDFVRALNQHQALLAMRPAVAARPVRWVVAAAVIAACITGAILMWPARKPPPPREVVKQPVVETPAPPPPAPVPVPVAPPPVPPPEPPPVAPPEPPPSMPDPPPPPPAPPPPEPDKTQPAPAVETAVGPAKLRVGDATIELAHETRVRVAAGRVELIEGVVTMTGDLAIATPHLEATLAGHAVVLCGASTRVDVVKGKAQLKRPGDKRALDVGAGQTAIAGRGVAWGARRTPPRTLIVIAEDFESAERWTMTEGVAAKTGALEMELAETHRGATAASRIAGPMTVATDVELTSRTRGAIVAVRLHAYRGGAVAQLVHADLMDDQYWLTVDKEVVRAQAPVRVPRRERWTIDVGEEHVRWLVDGEEVVKARRGKCAEAFAIELVGKSQKPMRVRFDNVLVEVKR